MKKFSEIAYSRPDFISFKRETLTLLDNLKNAGTFEQQKELVYAFNWKYNELDTTATMAYLRFSANTANEFYVGEKDWWDYTLPELSLLSEKYYNILINSPFRSQLENEFGSHLFTTADLKIKVIDDRILEDRKKENKLCSAYSKLLASAKIDWAGEKLNLSQLAPFTVSSDRAVRKKASDAVLNFLSENRKQLDQIYDDLTQLRDEMAKKIGFNNFVELGYYQMRRSDYTPEMVAKFRQKIKDLIVPLVNRLNEKQAKRIGVDHLKHFDEGFKFKNGNPKPKGSPDWIVKKAKEMFAELSPETAAFFNFLTEHDLMDLETRKDKEMGGYCTFLPSHQAPFIFSNFNGTSDDIRVLIHEAGHAFQKHQSKDFKVKEYLWPTSESAEMHSMSMEFFTLPWMALFFQEDAEKFKFKHIASTLEFLPYGVSVDEFQHRVYKNPNMTPEERNQVWREIEKKYKPKLDYDGNIFAENGGRWQKQMHIYLRPFYYIDYALAQVCALQFWVRMQEDFESAWKDYLTLCKAGGSMPFLQLVELAGLQSPFENGAIEAVATKVEAYLDSVDDAAF